MPVALLLVVGGTRVQTRAAAPAQVAIVTLQLGTAPQSAVVSQPAQPCMLSPDHHGRRRPSSPPHLHCPTVALLRPPTCRRRIVPGEYVAVDPKGRACMVAAVEKSKFVYVLNRDNDARLTISSPLEVRCSGGCSKDVNLLGWEACC